MKTELTIISDDLNHGVIDEKQARNFLLDLLGVSGSCSCGVKYVETKKSDIPYDTDDNVYCIDIIIYHCPKCG